MIRFIIIWGQAGEEGGGGVGGKVSPRKSVVHSTCQYDVTSGVGEKTDKNFDLITEMLFRFLFFFVIC